MSLDELKIIESIVFGSLTEVDRYDPLGLNGTYISDRDIQISDRNFKKGDPISVRFDTTGGVGYYFFSVKSGNAYLMQTKAKEICSKLKRTSKQLTALRAW